MLKSLLASGLILVASVSVGSQVAFAGAYDELTPAQKTQIQKGEQVFFTVDVPGAKWPKAFVYQRVDATPEECAAVFFDFNRHKEFIPSLSKSQISGRLSARTVNVDYTLEVPLFADEDYTVRNTLSSYDNGGSYKVEWSLVRADSTKSSDGNMRFEALGTGTILAYYNYVVPGSSLAGMVRNRAMKQVQETAQAVAKQVVLERTSQVNLLNSQLTVLRNAISAP